MDRTESTWRYHNMETLLHVVGILSRTSGVFSIRVLPGKVVFDHDRGLDVKALEFPDEPTFWDQRMKQLHLRTYQAKSLRECLVFGWEEFRKRQRFATHLCVRDRDDFYRELFGDAAWTDVPRYFDEVYGMDVVELGADSDGALPKGTVVMCGGRRFRGTVDDSDFGLILKRSS